MRYHYTESGLRNVYLQNGFTVRSTPYGETVAIQDVPGLHQAIGRLLLRKKTLTGSEFRFLRKELDLSQRAIAEMCGATEQSVSLWERRGRAPGAAQQLLRVLYDERLHGTTHVKRLLQELSELDRQVCDERFELVSADGQWRIAA